MVSAPFLTEPFDRDELAYGVVARLLLDGGQPYRDLFDHKPPLIYLWFALSFELFGENEWGPRILGALALSGAAAGTMVAAAMLYGSRARWIAGTIFGLACGVALVRPYANLEPFMLLPMCWSLVFALRARGGGGCGSIALAAVFASVACLTKPVALPNAAVVLWLCVGKGGWQDTARWMAWFATPAALLGLWFVGLGTADEALYANVTYNLLYAAELPVAEKLRLLAHNGVAVGMASGPVVLAGTLGAARILARHNRDDRVALAWLAASIAGTAATGRFAGHYFIQMFPAMAIAGAAAFAPMPGWLDRVAGRRMLTAAIGAAATLAVAGNLHVYTASTAVGRAENRDGAVSAERDQMAERVSAFLKTTTSPEESVVLIGRDTGIFWYSQRVSASRFIFDMPLWLDDGAFREMLRTIESEQGDVVVDLLAGLPRRNPADPRIIAVRAAVEEHYVLLDTVEQAKIYRRR